MIINFSESTSVAFHKISPPIPPGSRNQIDFQIIQLVKANIIRETDSPYSSPLLIVKKPNSKEFRLVLNLAECNKFTKYLSIQFQSADDVLSSLKG